MSSARECGLKWAEAQGLSLSVWNTTSVEAGRGTGSQWVSETASRLVWVMSCPLWVPEPSRKESMLTMFMQLTKKGFQA